MFNLSDNVNLTFVECTSTDVMFWLDINGMKDNSYIAFAWGSSMADMDPTVCKVKAGIISCIDYDKSSNHEEPAPDTANGGTDNVVFMSETS